MSARAYPLPGPPSTVLSSFGLAYDVGKVFELSGLPVPTTADLDALREVLLRFVYDAAPETGDELLAGLEKARAEEDRIAGELAVSRLDEDQPLAARGHVQVDVHGIPALGAASLARLLNGAHTESEESQR